MLIEGAGIPGTESICRHGVAWYASRLGSSLLSLVPDRSLSTPLAEAIEQVTNDHWDTCDVANLISPSATAAILRLPDGLIEHLVLGDSFLLLDRADGVPLVVSDPQEVITASCTFRDRGPLPLRHLHVRLHASWNHHFTPKPMM